MQAPIVEIDGIAISAFPSLASALQSIFPPGRLPVPGFAVAVNPEKIMAARRDPEVRQILNSATLRFADGYGVAWTMRRRSRRAVCRIAGYDLWEALMLEAGRRGVGVFLVGAAPEVLAATRSRLEKQFGLAVVGFQDGYFRIEDTPKVIERISACAAHIVCVAMGSPRQERFITECRRILPGAFYIGVGGSFDVFSGVVRRAPKWVQAINLEWAYRFAQTPLKRARRMTSVFEFAWLSITKRL